MTKQAGLDHQPTQVLFLRVYHNLPGITDGEEIDYYTPGEYGRLQEDLVTHIKRQFDLFSESHDYGDYFSCADYGIPEDWLDDSEIETFRSVLDPDERTLPLSDLHSRSMFKGYRTVVERRVQSGDIALIREAIELFNFVMECALPTDDPRNPRCYLWLQTAEEFAPLLIDNLLGAIQALEEPRSMDSYQQYLGEAFGPLEPLLRILAVTVHHERWPHNDLALGKFLLIVDHYICPEAPRNGLGRGRRRRPLRLGEWPALRNRSEAARPAPNAPSGSAPGGMGRVGRHHRRCVLC